MRMALALALVFVWGCRPATTEPEKPSPRVDSGVSDATDATLDERVSAALHDTIACLRWTTAERGDESRERLADALEAARTAIADGAWANALDAYDDGLDEEGQGFDFGLIPLQLVRMLALGRLGRPIAASIGETEHLAREAHDTGMAAMTLTVALVVARFHRSFPSLTHPNSVSLVRMGLANDARSAVEVAWALGA